MLLRRFVSLAVAVLVALADYGAAQRMDSYVEIDLTDVTGPSRNIQLAAVCGVNITGLKNSSLMENCTENDCSLTRGQIEDSNPIEFNTNRGQELTVFLAFNDPGRVACSPYIFNKELEDTFSFQCNPVRLCNDPGDALGGTIVWSKFFDESNLTDFYTSVSEDDYTYPECSYNLTQGLFQLSDCDVSSASTNAMVTFTDDNNIINNIISISNADKESLGYYLPSLVSNGTTLPGQVVVVYYNPEFTNDDDRNYTVVEGKNTDAVECVARSFPPAVVTWRLSRTLDGLDDPDTMIFEDPGHRNFSDIGRFMPSFDRTIDGQIIIMNASSVDAGFYRCTVTNEGSGESIVRNRILRVRDTLRPLWPAIGFILTLISVAVIIGVNSLIEKIRGEKEIPVDDDDLDGDVNERTYSTSDHDSPTSTERDHEVLRRLSSARQELLPNS